MTEPPETWMTARAPALAEIEGMAYDAFAALPEKFRALCADLVIRVDDYSTDDVLDDLGIESALDLMGLFQGVGIPLQGEATTGQLPNMIWLYRIPILVYWAEHEETLGAIITHVLVHEIGHHFGMSDDDMHAIEAAAD
jgi:predicted Zn-dependent protease with MMP-like domain